MKFSNISCNVDDIFGKEVHKRSNTFANNCNNAAPLCVFDVVVVRLRGFTRLHRIRGRLHGPCELEPARIPVGQTPPETKPREGQGLKCFSMKVQVINETQCLIDRLIKCFRCF